MIKIVLVSHGDLAEGIFRAAESILGPQVEVAWVGLDVGESPEMFRERLCARLSDALHSGDVLVMVDIWGGTPWNVVCTLAAELLSERNLVVISGVNLGMLLEALAQRAHRVPLSVLVRSAMKAGAESIRCFNASS